MPRETTPDDGPLPTSKSSTAFFNSLNLSTQHNAKKLSSMGSFTRTSDTKRRSRPLPTNGDDDDDLNYFDASLGVGVKDAKKKAREMNQAQEDLRKRMFGKRRREEEEQRRREGSSEEEEGKGGVGRKKKARRVREDDAEQMDMAKDTVYTIAVSAVEEPVNETGAAGGPGVEGKGSKGGKEEPSKKKKKKNRNKKKRKVEE